MTASEMSKQIQIWIRECAALSDYELSQQLKSINEQPVKSFLAAIEKSSTDQTKQVTIRELEIAGKHARDTKGRNDTTMILSTSNNVSHFRRLVIKTCFFHTDNQEGLKLRIKEHL
jgi:hypothetical protein